MEPIPKRKAKARSKKPRTVLVISVLVIIILGAYITAFHTNKAKQILGLKTNSNNLASSSTNKPFRFFSGYDFKTLYLNTAYPNTYRQASSLVITGNTVLDARIHQIAESRDYQVQSVPTQPIADLQASKEKLQLQPLAFEGAQSLLAQAKTENIPLEIQLGFVDYNQQRNAFMAQLGPIAASPEQIVNGELDARITQVIEKIAPPGYSRLQTGYAITVGCANTSGLFNHSSCYSWLRANNYAKAKQNGFIPSYSDGVGTPDTKNETQYVWVGKSNLY